MFLVIAVLPTASSRHVCGFYNGRFKVGTTDVDEVGNDGEDRREE